jgi:hypothetical protein
MVRVMESPEITMRAITWEGDSVGSIASFVVGSLRVLEKTGFRIIGTEVSFAPACGAEIEETILQLG